MCEFALVIQPDATPATKTKPPERRSDETTTTILSRCEHFHINCYCSVTCPEGSGKSVDVARKLIVLFKLVQWHEMWLQFCSVTGTGCGETSYFVQTDCTCIAFGLWRSSGRNAMKGNELAVFNGAIAFKFIGFEMLKDK